MASGSHSGAARPQAILFRTVVPAALIVCATVLAYLPTLSGDFIWNDSDYVTAPELRSVGGLVRIWTDPGAAQQYYPLLHGAFWVQHRLWGDHPLGYHLLTLLLHAGSAVLFALVLRRLMVGGQGPPGCAPAGIGQSGAEGDAGGRRPSLLGSCAGVEWLAALLFALHPVHVESVAWISEQKNTFSLAFYLAAALVYLQFDETRRPRTYVVALVLFVCSLGCKTVTATLPAALLVVFWWKRGRLGWRRDALPLLPWLAFGAAAGMFSSWVERIYVGAQGADFQPTAIERILVAGRAVWFYAGKLVWPSGLNFIYPRWTVDAAVWWQWLFPLGVVAVGAVLWALWRRSRAPLAAFLLFTGSLVPVLGFVNLYGALYSWVWDHWQYLPDLGPIALAAAGLTAGWRRAGPRLRWLGTALVAGLAGLLGALTWSHCEMFQNDEALYRATLERNPDCWLAHNNLGTVWSPMPGRLDDAVAEFKEALRLNPRFAQAHNNLGTIWSQAPDRLNDAIAEFEEALRLKPGFAQAHYNLGLAWSQLPGRLNDAIAEFREALRLQPGFVVAHINLGSALARLPGRLDDAIAEFEEALRLKPESAEAHYNLGTVLSQLPARLNDAVAQYEEALRLKPDYVEAHYNLGSVWSQMPGRLDNAVAEFREALRLNPNFAPGWHNLGASLFHLGNLPAAAAAFREELRLSPNDRGARQALTAVLQSGGENQRQ